jgi:hypothetical protein
LLYEYIRAKRIDKGEPKSKELIPTTMDSFTESHLTIDYYSKTPFHTQQERSTEHPADDTNIEVTEKTVKENESIVPVLVEEKNPDEPSSKQEIKRKPDPSFEEIFRSKEGSKKVIDRLKREGILNADEQWQGLSGNLNEIVALILY